MSKRKYSPEFVSYLRGYGAQMEYTAMQEAAKIKKAIFSDPARAQALAQAYPDPKQQALAIQQKAAQNAQAISQALLAQKQKEFGVKQITPSVLREAFHEDRAQYEPDEHVMDLARANGVTDPAADYRQNVLPKSVDHDISQVAPYLFPQQKPVEMQPETITAAPPRPAARPAPTVQQAPAPQTETQGTSLGGDQGAPEISGGGEGGDTLAGGARMYQPGTER